MTRQTGQNEYTRTEKRPRWLFLRFGLLGIRPSHFLGRRPVFHRSLPFLEIRDRQTMRRVSVGRDSVLPIARTAVKVHYSDNDDFFFPRLVEDSVRKSL